MTTYPDSKQLQCEMTVRVGIRTELSTDARVRYDSAVLSSGVTQIAYCAGIFSPPERSEHVEPHLLGR